MERDQKDEIRYLLDKSQRNIKEVLIDAENILKEQITVDPNGDSHIDFNHPADMITGDNDYEKELEIMRRQRMELALVHSAIERLNADEYGKCLSCGEEIPFERLKALPYAKFCVKCQALEEADETDRSHRINTSRTDIMGERTPQAAS